MNLIVSRSHMHCSRSTMISLGGIRDLERVLIASVRDLSSLDGEQQMTRLTASRTWYNGLTVATMHSSDVIQFDF
jgi:hypothetical protein